MESTCLGLKILGSCSYDPAAPSISYFTIGQLVAVVAFLLAFSQLTRPIFMFRIRAHRISYKAATIIFTFAIAFVFLSAILPFIPGPALPLIGYPVFWEFLAGLFFVVVAGALVIAITKKPTFKRRNAEAYLNACAAIIAKGNDDDLRELADEILPAVKPIFNECKSYNQFEADRAKEQGHAYQVQKVTRIAFTILDLWSDVSFCKNIVCKAPATALEIFDQLIHNDVPRSTGYALSQQLIQQAFVNRDSILMREEDYSGLGFFKQFRNSVFGDWQFIEGAHRPLQAWRYYEGDVKPWQVRKYSECLLASFQAYLGAKDYWQHPASLFVGLDHLSSLAGQQITAIRHMDERDLYRSAEFNILSEVQSGFEKIVEIVEKNSEGIPEYELDEDDYDRFKDNSIYGVVAYGTYDYLEKLSMTQRYDDAIRQFAIGLWLRIFGVASSEQSKAAIEISKRLIIHLNKKINENLDPEQRWYPAITRLLISLNGIYEPKDNENADSRIAATFHREFIQRLKRDYPRLARKEPDFASHLLPENVTYDSASNEIKQKRFRQKIDVLRLLPLEEE